MLGFEAAYAYGTEYGTNNLAHGDEHGFATFVREATCYPDMLDLCMRLHIDPRTVFDDFEQFVQTASLCGFLPSEEARVHYGYIFNNFEAPSEQLLGAIQAIQAEQLLAAATRSDSGLRARRLRASRKSRGRLRARRLRASRKSGGGLRARRPRL